MDDNRSESSHNMDPSPEQFDCMKAIYSESAECKLSEAKVYDSVEQCIAGIFGRDKKKTKDRDESEHEVLERRFLPEQMPVKVERKPFRHVLLRMEEFTHGPLATIKKWSEEKVKVKVWTRGINEIRGVLTGFVVAYDKHWNLALVDVDEHFNRPRKRKTYFSEQKLKRKLLPSDLPLQMKYGSSAMKIIKIQGKYEVCVRHVPQILLRGEQVAMIGKAN